MTLWQDSNVYIIIMQLEQWICYKMIAIITDIVNKNDKLTDVAEAWSTTFHSRETRVIISALLLSPPVIRKLTHCSHRVNYALMPRRYTT